MAITARYIADIYKGLDGTESAKVVMLNLIIDCLPPYLLRVWRVLGQEEAMTSRDVADRLGIQINDAWTRLDKLEKMGIVNKNPTWLAVFWSRKEVDNGRGTN